MAYRIIVLPSAETDLEKLDLTFAGAFSAASCGSARTLPRSFITDSPTCQMSWPVCAACGSVTTESCTLFRQQGLLKMYRIQHRSEVYRYL